MAADPHGILSLIERAKNKSHINDILKAFAIFERNKIKGDDLEVVCCSFHDFFDIYYTNRLFERMITVDFDDSDSASNKFDKWLIDILDTYLKIILSNANQNFIFQNNQPSSDLCILINSYWSTLQIVMCSNVSVKVSEVINQFFVYFLELFLDKILEPIQIQSFVKIIENHLSNDDFKFLLSFSVRFCLRKLERLQAKDKLYSSRKNYSFNLQAIFELLKRCHSLFESSDCQKLFFDRLSLKISPKSSKKLLSLCWLQFLKFDMEKQLLIMVLMELNKSVIPFVTNPQFFADFFLFIFDQGGILAISSLQSLYNLMVVHNLECDRFFEKLYQLTSQFVNLDNEIIGNAHGEFWSLLMKSLSGSHLPAYLLCAFTKRLARLAITSSLENTISCLLVVGRLLSMHSSTRYLLHLDARKEETSTDPFLSEEPDPRNCKALKSYLWELEYLMDHYCPIIVQLVQSLREDDPTLWKWRNLIFSPVSDLETLSHSSVSRILANPDHIDFFKGFSLTNVQ